MTINRKKNFNFTHSPHHKTEVNNLEIIEFYNYAGITILIVL
jgi:hypothetical protein